MSIELTSKETEYLTFLTKLLADLTDPSTFTSIGMFIEHWAITTPNNIGLLFEDKSWTWKAINEENNKVANFFINRGLKIHSFRSSAIPFIKNSIMKMNNFYKFVRQYFIKLYVKLYK